MRGCRRLFTSILHSQHRSPTRAPVRAPCPTQDSALRKCLQGDKGHVDAAAELDVVNHSGRSPAAHTSAPMHAEIGTTDGQSPTLCVSGLHAVLAPLLPARHSSAWPRCTPADACGRHHAVARLQPPPPPPPARAPTGIQEAPSAPAAAGVASYLLPLRLEVQYGVELIHRAVRS
jgi:hypothetical protein